ncbi:MAG: DEAD/DEAH box helicase [Chitinophagales bacterium]
MIASAQTGTGKTAAFLLPIIHRLITQPIIDDEVNVLVIVPTRELAVQIAQNLEAFSYFRLLALLPFTAAAMVHLLKAKKEHCRMVLTLPSTPGRMLSHLAAGYVRIKALKYLVLDEADRILNMGFYEDIMKIISFLPQERQTLLFQLLCRLK